VTAIMRWWVWLVLVVLAAAVLFTVARRMVDRRPRGRFDDEP